MPWITDAELLAAVASVYQTTAAAMPSHWTVLTAAANVRAYTRLRRVMANKGFTPAQLNVWEEREAFNRACGLCLALREGGLPENREGQSLTTYCDVWKELDGIGDIYDEDGNLMEPAVLTRNIETGVYDTTDDEFTPDTVL